MSAVSSVSYKTIIDRVIRNIRLTDMTLADDILAWTGEGMDRMLIKSRQKRQFKWLTVEDFCHPLPCGIVTLDAVIHNGCRLRYGFGEVDPKGIPFKKFCDEINSYFVTDMTVDQADGSTVNEQVIANKQAYDLVRGANLKMVTQATSVDYYFTELDYLKTSFDCGTVLIFYKVRPADKEGYPLIPDIEDAKEGLFYYICSKLLFAGYKLPDPSISFQDCDNKATLFFRKAKNEIKRLGLNEKESQLQSWVSLIPPRNYYNNLSINSEQAQYVVK